MSERGVILVGGGGHCSSVIDVMESAGIMIAGIVHGPNSAYSNLFSYLALGMDDDLPRLRSQFSSALVTVGQIKSSHVRQKLYAILSNLSFCLPTVVSPYARVSPHALLGPGTVVMHKAVVNAASQVGENCIINTMALVEHGCNVGSHCHIAINALLGGDVTVGEGTFIGAGAIVKPGVTIGNHCVVGMGCKVLQDLRDGECFVG